MRECSHELYVSIYQAVRQGIASGDADIVRRVSTHLAGRDGVTSLVMTLAVIDAKRGDRNAARKMFAATFAATRSARPGVVLVEAAGVVPAAAEDFLGPCRTPFGPAAPGMARRRLVTAGAVPADPRRSYLPLVVLIHFVDEEVGEPLCRRPERTNWLWTADPGSVTCAGCWRGVETRGVREPPVRAVLNEV